MVERITKERALRIKGMEVKTVKSKGLAHGPIIKLAEDSGK